MDRQIRYGWIDRLVEQIGDKIEVNCALLDKSMKFGTVVEKNI